MFRFLIIFSLITVLVPCSFAQEEILQLPEEEGPVTGRRTQQIHNGQEMITVEIDYVDGKIEGEVVQYYEDGTVGARSEYKNDLPEGRHTVYYKDGTIQLEGEYSKGLPHGQFKSYNQNGELLREWTMEEGKQAGETIEHIQEIDLPEE